MHRTSLLRVLWTSIFIISLSACEQPNDGEILTSENAMATYFKKVPSPAIRRDFSQRVPFSVIDKYFRNEDFRYIDFTTDQEEKGISIYQNNQWSLIHKEIASFEKLPEKVQTAFKNAPFVKTSVHEIYKTERNLINEAVYTILFRPHPNHMKMYALINEDGLFLEKCLMSPCRPELYIELPQDQLDFIEEQYSDAEIRGYIYYNSRHQYYILDHNVLKIVRFLGKEADNRIFWDNTTYELDKDTPIPDNVIKAIHFYAPRFSYTHAYYIESSFNSYHLVDMNDEHEHGYIMPENVDPESLGVE